MRPDDLRLRFSRVSFSRALRSGVALAAGLCLCGARTTAAPIPHGTLELIAENQWIETGRWANLGLRFQLEKGWHIYWINPGDSGEPPRVKWQLPQGLTTGDIKWPAPEHLGTTTIVDFGYQDAVTLIVPMRADASLAAQASAQIAAEVKVLVCREMCIPGKAQLSVTLPIKSQQPAPDSRTESLFAAARKSLPRPAPGSWKFSVIEDKDSFSLKANVGRQVTQAVFYPLVESQVSNSAPQKLTPAAGGFQLTLQKSEQLLKPLERLKGVLVLDGQQPYAIDAPVSKRAAAADGDKKNDS